MAADVDDPTPAYGLTVLDIDMDDKVLDYGDALLRVRDVALLTGPRWVNDALMAFAWEHQRRTEPRDDVALVDAAVTFLVANMPPSDVADVLRPLRAHEATTVLFQVRPSPPTPATATPPPRNNARRADTHTPRADTHTPPTRSSAPQVNDNADVSRVGGGTHWSLLAYLRGVDGADDAFLHFDSLGGVNASAANALAAAAAEALGGPRAVAAARNVRHDPPDTPRQTNGYDCGLYVLEVADAVCDARGDERRLRESLRAVTPARVAVRRAEMLALVERLAEEAE